MDVVTIALDFFDAGHTTPEPPCERFHGHLWTVRVEITAALDPHAGRARGSKGLESALGSIVHELDNRSLDEMIPGTITTPTGVAAWIMERLLLAYPKITAVEVQMGRYAAARVTRQVRD